MKGIVASSLMGLALAACLAACHEGSSPRLDCTQMNPVLLSYISDDKPNPCSAMHKQSLKDDNGDMLKNFDLIQACSCALVSKTMLWRSMMNYEMEILYEAVKTHLDLAKKERKYGLETKFPHSNWDDSQLLDAFSVHVGSSKYRGEIELDIRIKFAKLYIPNIDSGKLNTINPESVKSALTGPCVRLASDFQLFETYMNIMGKLAKNSRLIQGVASYDDNLAKILVVRRVCDYLMSSQ